MILIQNWWNFTVTYHSLAIHMCYRNYSENSIPWWKYQKEAKSLFSMRWITRQKQTNGNIQETVSRKLWASAFWRDKDIKAPYIHMQILNWTLLYVMGSSCQSAKRERLAFLSLINCRRSTIQLYIYFDGKWSYSRQIIYIWNFFPCFNRASLCQGAININI